MATLRIALVAALVVAHAGLSSGRELSATSEELLPRPSALEPNIRFWTRIYSEVGDEGGLIHDSEHLDVVYEVVRFPRGTKSRTREKRVEKAKKGYRTILFRLGEGKRNDLSPEEARVLSRWPSGVSNKTLRAAANRVRFQRGQAEVFRSGLVRSGNWMDYIERVLVEHGVPVELAALPHVESSFNPRAYSRVGAAGLWQFTRSTGRLYLRVDHVVDERMDPYAATVGAARLLRDNHRRLKSWPLAITAYNHGAGGMDRAVRKLGTRDMGRIAHEYDGRTFGFASRNFYAEFLAASEIATHMERYFGALLQDPPLDYQILEMDAFYSVATLERALGVERNLLEEHNLALRPSVWNGAKLVPKGYRLRLPPRSRTVQVGQVLASIPDRERLAQQHRDRFHKVRRGETLSKIARRYDTSMRELVALNNLRSRHRIRVGQVLRLPDGGRGVVARREPPSNGIYRVEKGDSLWIIAQHFGVSQKDLARWNSLRNRNHLKVGQTLRVSAPPPAASAPKVVASAPSAATDAVIASATPSPEPPPRLQPGPEADPRPEPKPATAPPTPEVTVVAARTPRPSAAAPKPAAKAAQPPANGLATAGVSVPDPSNYAVTPAGKVTVQAEETLGHYAEWLEVPTSRLRSINRMRYGTPLAIGRQKKLDFSKVSPETFEQRRLVYHRELQEEFFAAWEVSETSVHTLKRGQSLWYVAHEKYEVPIWLLRQYNPNLDFSSLRTGTPMVIPRLEPRG